MSFINFFQYWSMLKKGSCHTSDVLTKNVPALLIKRSVHTIWSWCFERTYQINCLESFFTSDSFSRKTASITSLDRGITMLLLISEYHIGPQPLSKFIFYFIKWYYLKVFLIVVPKLHPVLVCPSGPVYLLVDRQLLCPCLKIPFLQPQITFTSILH